ncbi:unnamed protein product [Cylindrotheca closterium]|uniref:Nudix hydrolase domain-containing protein n=1 Tax=Cylindrotheca closterium TaxID=2856 RepID=A0AAD2CCZ3_9STRA|nr:unnamed protein product [Cylindrotheca closterium]
MSSYPNHWAGISGTIEAGETPLQAAQRELQEETSLAQIVESQGGLFVNVPYLSKRTQETRIIRVYPHVVLVPETTVELELRGTEHDSFKFITVQELLDMNESDCVPGLVQAFHHATHGKFDNQIPESVKQWASDEEHGASVMTRNALALLEQEDDDSMMKVRALQISILRPSMVSIVNVMQHIVANGKEASVTMESTLGKDLQDSVALGQATIRDLVSNKGGRLLKIATYSRSGTLVKILAPFVEECEIVCSQSTPGNEGELMAQQDLKNHDHLRWVPDEEMEELLANGKFDALLVGSDCILPDQMVNKVGTKRLCEIAQKEGTVVCCCADKWKIWEDVFPPPIEEDLFELVPLKLVSKLLVPGLTS